MSEMTDMEKWNLLMSSLNIPNRFHIYDGASRMCGVGWINIENFDKWLHYKFGNYEDKKESMEDQVNKLPHSDLIKYFLGVSDTHTESLLKGIPDTVKPIKDEIILCNRLSFKSKNPAFYYNRKLNHLTNMN